MFPINKNPFPVKSNMEQILRDMSGADPVPPRRSENKVQNVQKPTTEAELLLAKIVHVYKYDGGHYRFCEKLQIALIKILSIEMYQILLYVNKQVIVSVTTITPDLSYIIQKNNYCTYQDDTKCLWSIKFDDVSTCMEVAREICVCKYFSGYNKLEEVLCQDLTQSDDEQKIEEGDTVTLKYSIVTHITQPLKVSNDLDVCKLTVKITSDNTWERYLCGCSKKSRRILILPPSKQISLGGGFPREKEIALEVEIIDIQKSNVNLELQNEKASLLFRMAKMGHSILPKQSTSPTDSEDTEDEDEGKATSHKKILPKSNLPVQQIHRPKAIQNINHKTIKSRSTTPAAHNSQSSSIQSSVTSPVQPQQPTPTSENSVFSFPQHNLTTAVPVALDPNLNIFLSETRTQNAEIRMNMTRIADNVQKLLDKFHTFEVQQATSPTNNVTLEALKMLLTLNSNTLQNNNMKCINGDSDVMVNEVNRLTKIIEEKDQQLKEKDLSLQNMQEFMAKKEELERINLELNRKVENLEQLENNQTEELNELLQKIKVTENTIEDCRNENIKLKAKIDELSNECNNLDIMQAIREKNREIKTIMYRLYREIMDTFTEESYKTSFINQTISSTIRRISLEVLNEKRHSFDKSDDSSQELNNTKEPVSPNLTSEADKTEKKSQMPVNENSTYDTTSPTENINISSAFNEEPPPISPMDINQND